MHTKIGVLFFAVFFLGVEFAATSIYAAEITSDALKTSAFSEKMPGPGAQFYHPGELGSNRIIDLVHAMEFGHLLIQDIQGRIKIGQHISNGITSKALQEKSI